MFDTSAAGHDFNIDNGTFFVDASADRVGIGTTTPSTLLDVNGVLTATSIAGTLTTAAQTNITSVGTLSSLTVSGALNGTLSTAAQTNITSLGTLTSLTVDTMTLNTGTISSTASNFILDAAGELHLDADDGIIRIRVGGGDYGMFQISNSDFIIRSMVADKHLIFKGNDGGSVINALTLDMSTAGTAIFNSNISGGGHLNLPDNGAVRLGAANDLEIYHDGSNTYIDNKTSGPELLLRDANAIILRKYGTSDNMIHCAGGGAVNLYHNGSLKLATTSSGIDITGSVTADGLDVEIADNAASPVTIQQGGNSYFKIVTTNSSESVQLGNTTTNPNILLGGGNVGIGTTTVHADLHLGASSPHIDLGPSSGNRGKVGFDSNNLYIGSTSGTGEIHFKNNISSTDAPQSSGDTKMIIGDSGVGIGGNHNPGAPLDIRGANNTSFAASAAGNPANLFLTGTNAYNSGYSGSGILFQGLYNSSSAQTTFGIISAIKENTTNSEYGAALTFMTRTNGSGGGNAERMRITSTGNVGIGTASPFGTTSNRVCLSVNGTSSISINGGVGGSQKIYVYADANAGEISTVGDIPLRLGNNGGPRMAVTSAGLIPHVADTYNLGSSASRWANGYFNDFHLSNEGTDGNDVDGTTGDWTIQEGEEHLYIINNKSGKKFRFALEEIT